MIATTVTSFECSFDSFKTALEHLKQNQNGTINITKGKNGREQYQWVGMYSHDYREKIHLAYLESGRKIEGFEDVGLLSVLGGKPLFINNKVYTLPLGFSNKNEISSIYQTLKNANFDYNRRVTKYSVVQYTDWRVPTFEELCEIFSTGLLPKDCYWFSNDIDKDVAECRSSYSYCGSYIDFSSKKSGHVTYREARNNAADSISCPSKDRG